MCRTLFSVYLPVRLYPHVILLFSLSPETVFFADFPPRTVTVLAIFLKFACRITVSDSRRSSAFSSSRVLYGATTLSRKASLLSPGFHGSGFRLNPYQSQTYSRRLVPSGRIHIFSRSASAGLEARFRRGSFLNLPLISIFPRFVPSPPESLSSPPGFPSSPGLFPPSPGFPSSPGLFSSRPDSFHHLRAVLLLPVP